MKKLVLTLACVFGMITAQAQYFVGGGLGVTYDGNTEETTFNIAPEFGYSFNDNWAVAGSIGFSHRDGLNNFFVAPYARWTFYQNDVVGLLLDGGFGVSINKPRKVDAQVGFEVGFKPGISFKVNDDFAIVGHVGFLGYRDNYNGNNVSGLSLSGGDLSVSLYYTF